jgi:hypothetical protein
MSESSFTLLLLAVIAVGIGALVFYVWTLVSAAKNSKWVWFVLILLVWPLCLVYLIFADKRPPQDLSERSRRVEPQ